MNHDMMLTVLSILSSRGQSPFHYFLCPVLSAEDGRPVIIIIIIVIQLHYHCYHHHHCHLRVRQGWGLNPAGGQSCMELLAHSSHT